MSQGCSGLECATREEFLAEERRSIAAQLFVGLIRTEGLRLTRDADADDMARRCLRAAARFQELADEADAGLEEQPT